MPACSSSVDHLCIAEKRPRPKGAPVTWNLARGTARVPRSTELPCPWTKVLHPPACVCQPSLLAASKSALVDNRCEAGGNVAPETGTLPPKMRLPHERQETHMDKDRIKGSAEQAKGKVKEVGGKITGDSKTEAEGKTDQAKGKIQNTVGGI